MPRGTRHVLTGTLRQTRFGYALEMDGGGTWRLDVGWSWKARRHVDRRVTVEGIRSGFDLLDVYRMNLDNRQSLARVADVEALVLDSERR